MSERVVRIAARGDGVTASGAYVATGVPGDLVRSDGSIARGPGYQRPPCRHFPECGGCQLQHLTDAAYRDYLVQRVEGALAQHGLATDIREPYLSPPNSRRRTSLKALRTRQGVVIGFHAERSTRIVDIRECHVLRRELFALVAPLRGLLATLLRPSRSAQLTMTLADQGVDLALAGIAEPDGYEAVQALTDFAMAQGLARLTLDSGGGAETRYEPVPVTVRLADLGVPLPPAAFLQATADGEQALVASVLEAVGDASSCVDLFAGLGTFALALPGRVTAVEAARAPVLALMAAANRAQRPVTAIHRDLYRAPLDAGELATFAAAVLDPPRAGAAEQVARLAQSAIPSIAYVSCNPATFAVDAAVLAAGGYRLAWVRPVGQFRWSTHVELAACFLRQ